MSYIVQYRYVYKRKNMLDDDVNPLKLSGSYIYHQV
jgi:hypothetical protein